MQPITIGNFDYTQEAGKWVYKAKEGQPLLTTKKPVYQEKPQLKLQETIENNSKRVFQKVIHATTIELINYLKHNLK